jgi:hypothetical protein
MPDQYHLKLALSEKDEDIETVENAIAFSIEAGDVLGSGRLPHNGIIVLNHHWEETERNGVR